MAVAGASLLEHRSLDTPDEQRTMEHGTLDIVNLPGITFVRATLRPGWRWSTDVKPLVGGDSCQAAHSAVILSGRLCCRMHDGRELMLGPGDAHVVSPGHDAWVVGDE